MEVVGKQSEQFPVTDDDGARRLFHQDALQFIPVAECPFQTLAIFGQPGLYHLVTGIHQGLADLPGTNRIAADHHFTNPHSRGGSCVMSRIFIRFLKDRPKCGPIK